MDLLLGGFHATSWLSFLSHLQKVRSVGVHLSNSCVKPSMKQNPQEKDSQLFSQLNSSFVKFIMSRFILAIVFSLFISASAFLKVANKQTLTKSFAHFDDSFLVAELYAGIILYTNLPISLIQNTYYYPYCNLL